MKNRSFLLITAICAAFAVMTAGSCSKADFSDEQQAMSLIVGPEIPLDTISASRPPRFFCAANGKEVTGTQLLTNKEYTFRVIIYQVTGRPMRLSEITIRNSSGEVVGPTTITAGDDQYTTTPITSKGEKTVIIPGPTNYPGDVFTMTFTTPDEYTIDCSTDYGTHIVQFTETYTVTNSPIDPGIEPGIVPGISSTPVLGRPFDLYLNLDDYPASMKTTVSVQETIFKKPYCTVVKKAENHYTITIKEPGAYIFTVNYIPVIPLDGSSFIKPLPDYYHVNIFYRPRLHCQSRRYGTNNYYENWAHLPGEIFNGQELISAGFPHRLCFDYHTADTGLVEIALPEDGTPIERTFMAIYTNEPEDGYGYIRLNNTDIPMDKFIYLEEDPYKPFRGDCWVIRYPQDECYMKQGTWPPSKKSEV